MSHARVIQVLGTLGLVACLVAAALLTGPINRQRQEAQLVTVGGSLGTDAPPLVNLLVSAGGPVRGLAINMLWYRLNDLKEQGQYYACNQLAEWVTELQPNFPQVWEFHAWNMAYNISVANLTREERWYWVNRGVALLRDRGIPLNPRAVFLYKELSWMFLHKIGGNSDDAHFYYKRKLAEEWEEVLGHPQAGQSDEEYLAGFAQIAAAPFDPSDPDSLAPLQRAHPAVTPLLNRLAALGYHAGDSGDRMLRALDRVYMFNAWLGLRRTGWSADVPTSPPPAPAAGQAGPEAAPASRERFDPKLRDLLITLDPGAQDALRDLLAFLRRRALVETYHMDPAFMLQLMRPAQPDAEPESPAARLGGYGPLDWRHPAAHSIYWGAMGVRMGLELLQNADQDMANTHRRVIHALQLLVDTGRITYDPVTGFYDQAPDTRFIAPYELAVEQAQKLEDRGLFPKGTAAGFSAGHENLLLKAIVYSRLYGDLDQARTYFEKARKLFGDKSYNQQSRRYEQPLDDLVFDQLKTDIDNPVNAAQLIDALLRQAITVGLMDNHPAVYTSLVTFAHRTYDFIQKKAEPTPIASRRRQGLPPHFEDMLAESWFNVAMIMLWGLPPPNQPGYAQFARPRLVQLSGLWWNTPIQTRLRLYDWLHPRLVPLCVPAGLDPDRAFPEPEGLEAYRQSLPPPPPDAPPVP
jgi:hypothetical protein